MNIQQERALKVLESLADIIRDSEEDTEVLSEELNTMLDVLAGDDFFGPEQQNDPRGDGREGVWDMWNVEGIDG